MTVFVVDDEGTPMQPEPGPIWLESYEYGERMYVPGWVSHTTDHWPVPGIRMERLCGPGVMRLEDIGR
jgi:hypothetical protein